MELSKRLKAVASLVTEGASVVDIGTDHAYIPIYLAQNKICSHMIAMDINRGPLNKAKEHILMYGYEDLIQTRLSDGLKEFHPGEADTMIAAGMGGALVIRILEDSPEEAASLREFILQPQSEIFKVRAYLNAHGYQIIEEDMVKEDGKYYPMMKVCHGEEKAYSDVELYYGRILLGKKHPVLQEFLEKEYEIKNDILKKLSCNENERTKERISEIQEEMSRIYKAREYFARLENETEVSST